MKIYLYNHINNNSLNIFAKIFEIYNKYIFKKLY